MEEIKRSIKNYEEQYEITSSGRIISKHTNKARHKKGDEHGYTHVHLSKNGIRKLYRTFDVWKENFPELDTTEYKGLKLIK
ncbi:hypothetical protein SAMN05421503_2265 [Terribacillus aidingensis]|uniref:NUMOD4 domain-containing protein n=1 Tax=Terribacillus aidingensis TaxID=586416 RepID=A0A285NXK0_9BACI|nr:NUMOD4 domain-containing protein [Terribacillus aidingensis]SNZ14210.1 hypothetical protein SAMN05421503_2265 [Terribacillus aidingensis]